MTKQFDGKYIFLSDIKEKRSFFYNFVSLLLYFALACVGFSYLTLTGEYPSMIYFIAMSVVLSLAKIGKVVSILEQ